MVHAYIMLETAAGTSERLVSEIRDLEEVGEAHVVAGDYDIIAEVDVPEVYEVLETVVSRLQGFDGVADTRTYVSLG